ncbi:MAG TPA: hypothetical protein VHO24_10535 [Opitutaceae bacterium]|nr:hypothetical protein [Opitutaceae bacterium]
MTLPLRLRGSGGICAASAGLKPYEKLECPFRVRVGGFRYNQQVETLTRDTEKPGKFSLFAIAMKMSGDFAG